MNYDLKETETTEAETVEHLMTVLGIGDRDINEEDWDEAREYLQGYIDELFKQIKEDFYKEANKRIAETPEEEIGYKDGLLDAQAIITLL